MMIERIGECAMLEQLAEEAAELAQAALKMARVKRKENPTPVTEEEAWNHLIEEYTDVHTCVKELGVYASPTIAIKKFERFLERSGELNDQQ